MSILKKSLTVIGVALAVTTTPTIFASGKINFTGEITDKACTVDSNSKNLNVDLGKISSKSLAAAGEFAGLRDFTIKLNDCPANSKAIVRFGGTQHVTDRDILAVNQESGVATNVGIALFEKDAVTQIKLYQDSKEITFSGTSRGASVNLNYVARYKATGVVTAGAANSSAIYSIQYQ